MSSAVTWSDLGVPDLDTRTLYDVLALRAAVFVVEQECAYGDPDGRDLVEGARHIVGRDGEEVAAYARVLAPGPDHPTVRIGRVVVASSARGRRLGRDLMVRALQACAEHWPGQPVELGAQAHLAAFYESLGFWPVGAGYVEDGIAHQWMRRETSAT